MTKRKPSWYAAHILMAVKKLDGRQRVFPVFENVVIFRASSPADVRSAAAAHAKREYEGDSSLTLGGRPAKMVFVGLRKIVECQEASANTGRKGSRSSPGLRGPIRSSM